MLKEEVLTISLLSKLMVINTQDTLIEHLANSNKTVRCIKDCNK